MVDEYSISESLLEQKRDLDLGRDYRNLTPSEFFEKHVFPQMNPVLIGTTFQEFLENLDAGVEMYDLVR